VDQELEDGLRSIAVPLHDATGRVVAAINVSTTTRRGTPEVIRAEILPHLMAASRDIERDLAAVNRGQSTRV
jgi:IclR family pca regulon transcriptional regulator